MQGEEEEPNVEVFILGRSWDGELMAPRMAFILTSHAPNLSFFTSYLKDLIRYRYLQIMKRKRKRKR